MENTAAENTKKKSKLGKILLPGFGIICTVFVFFLFTAMMRVASTSVETTNDMHRVVEKVAESYEDYYYSKLGAINTISMTYEDELNTIASILGDQGFYNFDEDQTVEACQNFKKIRDRSETDRLFVADKDGVLRIASSVDFLGVNIVERGIISKEDFTTLIEQADDEYSKKWLLIENNDGQFYFFIKKYDFDDDADNEGLYFIAGVDVNKVTGDSGLSISSNSLVSDAEHYGISCHVIISDAETGKVKSSSWYLIGENDDIKELGLPEEIFTDGASDEIEFEGQSYTYYSVTSKITDNAVVVTGFVPTAPDSLFEMSNDFTSHEFETMRNIASALVVMLIFVVAMTVFVGYGISLRENSDSKKTYLRKMSILALAVLIAFTALTYLPLSWMSLTRHEIEATSVTKRILKTIDDKQDNIDKILKYYENRQVASASLLAFALEEKGGDLLEQGTPYIYYEADKSNRPVPVADFLGNPTVSYARSEYLKTKGDYLGATEVYVLNEDGRTLVSSSDSWYYNMYQDQDVSVDYKRALFRQIPYYAGYGFDENGEVDGFYIAYPFDMFGVTEKGNTRYVSRNEYEEQGNDNGPIKKCMGLLAFDIDQRPAMYNCIYLDYETSIYNQASLHNCSVIKLSDKAGQGREREIYTSLHDPRELETINVPEGMKSDEYNYFAKVSGKNAYVHIEHDFNSDNYIFTIFNAEDVFDNAAALTAIYSIGLIIIMLIIGGIMVHRFKPDDTESYRGISAIKDALTITENGVLKHRNARVYVLINVLVIVLILGISLALYSAPNMLNGLVMFTNVFSEEWRRGFNSYNIIAALSLMITIFILMRFAKRLVGILSSILGRKGETIARISLSAVQYMTYFGGLFYCVYLLGLELKSVTTLATISVGVIGLGSQQLISDIFSGITMLAEGNFKVGDRILVNGFEGVVKDIGIRSTKILSDKGQIQSVANGNMKTIVIIPDQPKTEEVKPEETKH